MSTALYRRYRPDTYADVIGQEHVTDPLMTALGKDAVSHAYLFSGPRGCGKTTSARILARCLNCAQGPTGQPCGQCDSCRDLATGGPGSLDVIEIDAASHGGVDDARDLRERATFAPVRDRYKIFIIDEAHMVTAAGFNALLKIVEEPPEHIKFIFATTEPDKVIGTIRSRTHHYPFRLVPPEPLLHYVDRLCQAEQVPVAPGVLQLVLRAGGGSVRDTLSVLDQLIAGAGQAGVDYDRAVSLLGFTHAALLDTVVDSVASLDGAQAFSVVDQVVQSGQDPRRFVEDLLERLRDLIIVKSVPESPQSILRGVPEDQIRVMQDQSQRLGAGELSRAADITASALTDMVGATSPRLHLELLMARLLLPHAESTQASLAARLERLERRMDFTSGAGVTPAGEAPTHPEPRAQAHVQPDADTAAGAGAAAGSGSASASATEGHAPAQRPAAPSTEVPSTETPAGAESSGERAVGDSADRADQPQEPTAAWSHSAGASGEPDTDESTAGAGATHPVSTPAPPAHPPAATSGNSADMMQRAWPDIVDALKNRSRMLWMLVKGNVRVAGFDGQTVSLEFSNEGALASFSQRKGDEALSQAIQEILGMQVRLSVHGSGVATPSPPSARDSIPPKADGRSEHPRSAPAPADPAPMESAPAESQHAPTDEWDAPPPDDRDAPPEDPWDAPPPEDAWSPSHSSEVPAAPVQSADESRRETATSPVPSGPHSVSRSADSGEQIAPQPESPLAARVPLTPTVPAFARRSGSRPALAHEPPTRPQPAKPQSAALRPTEAQGSQSPTPGDAPRRDSEGRSDTAPPPDWAEEPSPPASEEDVYSEDDETLESSGLFGRRAVERLLGGVLLEVQQSR